MRRDMHEFSGVRKRPPGNLAWTLATILAFVLWLAKDFFAGLFRFTWPEGLIFVLSVAGWLCTRRRSNPWFSALSGLLLPLAIGFGCSTLLLLAMGFFGTD